VSAANGGTFSGAITVDADGATVATFDRATDNGTIIDLQKDGSTVGLISTYSDNVLIGTGATGARFYDATPSILPRNPTTGANADATIDFGSLGSRFKDLYLSGGVYLGGTGAANYLDDYEEGTWTPALEGSITAGTYSGSVTGRYRKVGGLLFLHFNVGAASLTGHSGVIFMTGLPFSVTTGSGFITYVEGGDFGYTSGTGNETLFIEPSGTAATFRPQNQNTSYDKYALTLTDGSIDHYFRGSMICVI